MQLPMVVMLHAAISFKNSFFRLAYAVNTLFCTMHITNCIGLMQNGSLKAVNHPANSGGLQ